LKSIATACAACAALSAFEAGAEDYATKVWLNPGLQSYHLNRSNDYREDNIGFGAEFVVAPDHGLLAGNYINSNNERSQYAGYHWRALHWRPYGVNLSAGPVFSMINGYSNMRDGGWFPAVMPALSAEYGLYGANITFIPNSKNGSAVAFQLKLLIW